jgi:hypothetical protein
MFNLFNSILTPKSNSAKRVYSPHENQIRADRAKIKRQNDLALQRRNF